jgi:hypothetical protein
MDFDVSRSSMLDSMTNPPLDLGCVTSCDEQADVNVFNHVFSFSVLPFHRAPSDKVLLLLLLLLLFHFSGVERAKRFSQY